MGIRLSDSSEMLNNSTLTDLSNYTSDGAITLHMVQTKWTLEYIILAVYLGLLSVIGSVGNVPVLIVYFHRREQTPANTFIKALAAIDLFVCSCLIPYTMVYELHLVRVDAICRIFEYLRHVAVMGSNLTLVAIASERYIAVCRITRKLSVKHINKGMFVIMLFSCLAAAPSVGMFAVVSKKEVENVKCHFNHDSVEGPFCHFTYTILGETLATVYQGCLMIIFFITLFVIVIFYIIVYIVLWKKTQFRKQIRKNNSQEISASFNSEPGSSVCEVIQKETWKYPKTKFIEVENSKNLLEDCLNDGELNKEINDKTPTEQNQKEVKTKRKIKHANSKVEYEKLRRTFHRRTAKMLFLCTVIYLLTWLPFWFDIFGATSNLVLRYFFFIGSASNPVVYGIVNRQIRRSFKKLFFEFARRWIKPCNVQQDIYLESDVRKSTEF